MRSCSQCKHLHITFDTLEEPGDVECKKTGTELTSDLDKENDCPQFSYRDF